MHEVREFLRTFSALAVSINQDELIGRVKSEEKPTVLLNGLAFQQPLFLILPRIADDAELMVGAGYYPLSAQKKREEGDCVVHLSVNEMGTIDGSRVSRSSASKELDQACIDAASHVPFLPAKSDGHAIASETALAMHWRLKCIA
jgi:TonB family protein